MVRLNKIKNEAEKIIDTLGDKLRDLSYRIHENPELSYEEYEARDLLVGELNNSGFDVETGIAYLETAFRGTYRIEEGGPRVCLMMEYDALKDLGHACGHNLSGVASLGAAIAVKEMMEKYDIAGELVGMGTPAEETGGAKADMVEAGLFDDLDAALMVNMFDRTVLDPIFIALNGVTFTFHGKPAHAAGAPEKGINALNGVISTFENVNALRQHVKETVRMHGIITNGGSAVNIVPELAEAKFFIRAPKRDYLDEVMDKVVNCARGAATATGAELDIDRFESIDELHSNPALTALFDENIRRYVSDVDATTEEAVGSTDVGTVSKVVPTIHPLVSITDQPTPLHTEEFAEATASEEGYQGMIASAKALSLTVLDLLVELEFDRRARETFLES